VISLAALKSFGLHNLLKTIDMIAICTIYFAAALMRNYLILLLLTDLRGDRVYE
jgi:hypothetical protein